MSVESVMSRIAELQTALQPKQASASANGNFQAVLGAQTDAASPAGMGAALGAGQSAFVPNGAGAGGGVQAMLQAASAEVGQAEQPPGSNDSPRIAEYRTATAGAGVGPWCAYFASWAAKQAGM